MSGPTAGVPGLVSVRPGLGCRHASRVAEGPPPAPTRGQAAGPRPVLRRRVDEDLALAGPRAPGSAPGLQPRQVGKPRQKRALELSFVFLRRVRISRHRLSLPATCDSGGLRQGPVRGLAIYLDSYLFLVLGGGRGGSSRNP